MQLRRMMCTVIVTALAAPALLLAQPPAAPPAASASIAPGDSLNGLMNLLEGEVVSAAEAMPADKYDFAPTAGEFKGVRNFSSQVKHLAESNYEFFQGWNVPGHAPVDSKTIEAMKSKDEIVQALKDSYVYAHAAIATLTPENAWEPAKSFLPPKFKMTRASAATFCIAHSMDHYGQLVEYLRMNGIIPPASRPRPASR
ncbi:MAG: DinB family protein [Acidobacteriota bacterium]